MFQWNCLHLEHDQAFQQTYNDINESFPYLFKYKQLKLYGPFPSKILVFVCLQEVQVRPMSGSVFV